MNRIFEVNGEYFTNKTDARVARGELVKPVRTEALPGGRDVVLPAVYKFEIHKGPDHWKRGGNVPGVALGPIKVPRVRRKKSSSVTC